MYIRCRTDPMFMISQEISEADAVIRWAGIRQANEVYHRINTAIPRDEGAFVMYYFQGMVFCTPNQTEVLNRLSTLQRGWFAAVRLAGDDYDRIQRIPEGERIYCPEITAVHGLEQIDTAPGEKLVRLTLPQEWVYVHIYFRRRRADGSYMAWKDLEVPGEVYRRLYPDGFPVKLHDTVEYRVEGYAPKVQRLLQLAATAAGPDVIDVLRAMGNRDTLARDYTKHKAHRAATAVPEHDNVELPGLEALLLSIWSSSA